MSKFKEAKVLVVDDDKDILDLLKYNLEKEGLKVRTVSDSRESIKAAEEFHPDLLLLDIMMPHLDGIDVCRQIREKETLNDVVIIFLTARVEEYTEVAAFGAGGDDYIIKPIRPRALLMRIRAILERKYKSDQPNSRIEVGDLIIDRPSYSVKLNGDFIRLARKEFELLFYLADNPNKVINRDKLLAHIWGTDVQVIPRTVDVHIRKIREKIGIGYIKTIKGVGYKFETS